MICYEMQLLHCHIPLCMYNTVKYTRKAIADHNNMFTEKNIVHLVVCSHFTFQSLIGEIVFIELGLRRTVVRNIEQEWIRYANIFYCSCFEIQILYETMLSYLLH